MLDRPDLSDSAPLNGAGLAWAVTLVGLLGMLAALV